VFPILLVVKNYHTDTQRDKIFNEKYLKKVLASSEKGRTFAPAFPKKRGVRKRRAGRRKFFDSLRPAQDQRHREVPRGKEPLRRNMKNIKAEPEIQRKNKTERQ
jgi:hypothetical protein